MPRCVCGIPSRVVRAMQRLVDRNAACCLRTCLQCGCCSWFGYLVLLDYAYRKIDDCTSSFMEELLAACHPPQQPDDGERITSGFNHSSVERQDMYDPRTGGGGGEDIDLVYHHQFKNWYRTIGSRRVAVLVPVHSRGKSKCSQHPCWWNDDKTYY